MKHALSYHDYENLCALAQQKDEKYEKQYVAAIDSLFTNWTHVLGHDKVCVLGFILSRTFKYGKAIAAIPFPAFLGGVTSERCATSITSALKISKNTLRNILKELIEDGFLHAFFPEKRRGVIDNFTRYFEIDFKKLQKLRNVGSEIMGILRQPKPKKPSQNTRRDGDSRLPKLGDLSIVHHKIPKGIYTAPPAGRGADEEIEQEVQSQETVKRIARTRPVPTAPVNAPIPAPSRSATGLAKPLASMQSIMARMQALQDAAKARREAKAQSAKGVKPSGLKQDQLQAMIDETMARYYPDLPRVVVTGKAFGAMKNHLKRSAPADLADFIDWVIRSWPQLAASHAKALRRSLTDSSKPKYDALPYAPQFAALGFRLPFFLACYNNRKAETAMMGDRETRDADAIRKAQRAAEQARQEAASLRALLRKQQEQQRRGPSTERPEPRVDDRQAVAGYDRSLEQDDLPTWESFGDTYKRKK